MSGVGTEQTIEEQNIPQIQSNWNEANNLLPAFIQNKPTIPAAQVDSDWNSVISPTQILNKPSIPAAQVNSDWNSVSGVSQILNKPTIPSIIGRVKSEILFTTDVTASINAVAAFSPIITFAYPVDAEVVDGRSRRIYYVINYSKTAGISSTAVRVVAGGITIAIPTSAIGNAARTNDTYLVEVLINFRTANSAHVSVTIIRYDSVGALVQQVNKKTIAVGTWVKTISNNVSLDWQIVSGAVTHTARVQQVTSELI